MTTDNQPDLDLQRQFFEMAVKANPKDETVRFALAQVLKEQGNEAEANKCYDEAIALVDRLWLRKLPPFTFISLVIAGGICTMTENIIFLIIAAVGPALWLYIWRNRRRYMPQIGYMRRQETLANVDIKTAL